MTTFEKVKELLANQLSVDPEKITIDSDIVKDLGADSLDIFEMLMTMEEEFDINLPDDKAKEIKNISDLVDFIDQSKA